MKKQSLVKGAIVLTFAAFITKILGFINGIIQSRILGSEGIGLMMMVMPLMGLIVTLTTLGLPTAISKLVAEAESQNNEAKIRKILYVSLSITGSTSIILLCVTLFFGDIFSSYFITDDRSYYSLLALSPIIPIIAISGVLKGFFRGKQNMNPIAFSQVLEQIVRISLIYVLVQWLLPYGIEFAAAGAVLASVIGEAISLGYLFIMYKRATKTTKKSYSPSLLKGPGILRELFQTGLPTTGNHLIHSITRVLQPIIITQSLAKAGFSSVLITKQYGMLTGFVMPLLFFPGFINHSLAVSLVPAISEANAQNNLKLIFHRIYQAIRIGLLIGAPSTVILYVFSNQLMTVVYQEPDASLLLKVMAPFFLFHYFQAPLQAALVGLGYASASMVNTIISKCTSILLIYPLSYNMDLGIYGVALAICIGFILETLLHFFSLVKLIGFTINAVEIVKICLAGIAMGYLGEQFFQLLKFELLANTCISIFLSLFIYFSFLVLMKIVKQEDIIRIPVIGKKFSRFFPK